MNPNHFKLLSERWAATTGKSAVSISDFPPFYSVGFSDRGKKHLATVYAFFENSFGIDAFYRKHGINLYCIRSYLKQSSNSISIKFLEQLKSFSLQYLPEFSFKQVTQEITALYNGSRPEIFLSARFPLSLEKPEFAQIIGLSFDSTLKQYCLSNTNAKLISNAHAAFTRFGFQCRVAEKSGSQKIFLGKIATKLLALSGFRVGIQTEVNNPLPQWAVYSNNQSFVGALVAALIDAEGNIGKRMISICQNRSHATVIPPSNYVSFPKLNVTNTTFIYKIPADLAEEVRNSLEGDPPLLLVSLQLLLSRFKIESRLIMQRIYVKRSGELCSSWQLKIFSRQDFEAMYALTKSYLTKRPQVEILLNNYTYSIASKRNQKVTDFLALIRGLQKDVFTSKDLYDYSKKKKKTVITTLSELKNKGFIRIAGRSGRFLCWALVNQPLPEPSFSP